MPRYSIIIPAYNEGARLGVTLDRVLGYVADRGWDAEVIVVNDGSKDNTAELVRARSVTSARLRLIENPGNRGKGYAVRNGMLSATGGIVLFTDADLSAPIEQAAKLFDAIESGFDVAVGSRWLDPTLQAQRQSPARQFYGRSFNLLLKTLLGLNFKDTQCGFKAFTSRAAHKLFSLQTIEGWGFDAEILYLARRLGFSVKEVPVVWSDRAGTRIQPIRDGILMVGEALAIRLNALRGRYPRADG
ncbi:MAG: glycosyltransferase family 2 protein [Acidobacteria bacterium]|nr:glycosyltransferase family 2 protein [Acidobacteriota bacterium]